MQQGRNKSPRRTTRERARQKDAVAQWVPTPCTRPQAHLDLMDDLVHGVHLFAVHRRGRDLHAKVFLDSHKQLNRRHRIEQARVE